MSTGTFQRLIAIFEEAFTGLGVDVSQKKLENLAITVHRAMTSHGRHFHTLEHVFTFINPKNPVQTLAALYHDIVYYQVDLGFTPDIWNILRTYIQFRDNEMYIIDRLPTNERLVSLTLKVFDFQLGQRLCTKDDLNEFLSALVMNCELAELVTEKDLLRMTVCIEATIPFRGCSAEGESHFDIMERRLRKLSNEYNIPFIEKEIEDAIKLAVIFANKDIENFGEAEPAHFIDNTWKLLPEMNVALRARDAYSIQEYRQALQRMEAFLLKLNPDNVFNFYRGVPPESDYRRMSQRARQNVLVACEYLKIKLLGLGILDALAKVTGGDAPLSLFIGDLPQNHNGNGTKRLEHFLPDLQLPTWIDTNSELYQLLYSSLDNNSGFDTRYAGLSLFLYKSLFPDTLNRFRSLADEMFAGRLSAADFLKRMNCPTVIAIARACAEMVPTRRKKLLQYADQLHCQAT